MKAFRFILIIFLYTFIFGCAEKINYSGKIITEYDLSNLKINNKEQLIYTFGPPSYIDNILNKYFYYTEKTKTKNFFDNKVEYSYLFIFELDTNNNIIGSESIDLQKNEDNIYNKLETKNNIIKRGILERVFGGVGTNQIPNSFD
jgi:outer membrane protein assembly factor BamE (lipoprotein component of BamABCDE complex)